MMFTLLEGICISIIWIGVFITLCKETSKKKQIGWLLMACATFIDSLLVLCEGRIISGGFIFAISLIDFYLYNFWQKRYNELIDNDKEKHYNNKKANFFKDLEEYGFERNNKGIRKVWQ